MKYENDLLNDFYALEYIFDFISGKDYSLDSFDQMTKHIKNYYVSVKIVEKFIDDNY